MLYQGIKFTKTPYLNSNFQFTASKNNVNNVYAKICYAKAFFRIANNCFILLCHDILISKCYTNKKKLLSSLL